MSQPTLVPPPAPTKWQPQDGLAFPDIPDVRTRRSRFLQGLAITVLVVGPLLGAGLAIWLLWGVGIGVVDVALAGGLYVLTAFGVTVGFHRGLTHRSYRGKPALMVVLALFGSLAFQGGVLDWVATHRRHHAKTDRPGDPHSPFRYGTSGWALFKGMGHAHVGWLFGTLDSPPEKYAPDLLADRGIMRVHKLFPLLCIASYVLPFALGALITMSWIGGLTALLWAGAVRIALLQHVTWSVNSVCHVFGKRPYATRDASDRATNFWPLALLSMGESWHNGHHAYPTCAQHGRRTWELDPSAWLIKAFEKLGWATRVRWA